MFSNRRISLWAALAVIGLGAQAAPALPRSEPGASTPSVRRSLTPLKAVELAFVSRPRIAAEEAQVQSLLQRAKALETRDPLRLEAGRGTDAVPGSTDNDLALTQKTDWYGKNRLAAAVVRAEAEVAEASLRQTKLALQTDVLRQFNEVVSARGKLAVAEELVAIATRFRDAAQRRVDAGVAPEVQLLRAGIEFDRAAQVRELRASELRAATARFSGVVGGFEGDLADDFFLRGPSEDAQVLLRRPDLVGLDAEIRVVDAQMREERSANRPEIEFQVRRSPWRESADLGVRLQVSVPLLDYGRVRRQLESLRLSREALTKRKEDVLRLAESERGSLLLERSSAIDQVDRLKALLISATDLLRISEKGFETGALTLLESLEAARALREVEEALLDAQKNLAQIDVAIAATEGELLVVNS